MPLPLLFIGVAAVSGTVGIGKTVKAGIDVSNAKKINRNVNEMMKQSTEYLNEQRLSCGQALKYLGEEKLYILNHSISEFLNIFTKIKNVDLKDTEGLDELDKFHLDEKEFTEMKELVNIAGSVVAGTTAGIAGGTLVAFGAYGAAQVLATASTGTAIASLSGAAATNATLAFFGGGSLAAGGLGMAGGTIVLGGLVAGPALMMLGFTVGAAAKKKLEKAYINKAEAAAAAHQMNTAALECEVIRRKTYMFYTLLAGLDTYFLPLIYKMEDIYNKEGDDYKKYKEKDKKVIAACAGAAVTIKTVLDTPLLTEEGVLTKESAQIVESTEEYFEKMGSTRN